ncbi:uncharacterized protein VTP21DRAFT_8476 [Calcarisporiella thermophila]|uniref:uncharacterized protein n=1 Tax=Calcarisporiella thermophila TaxID=911321 RepID=UPI003743AF6F
MNGKSSDTILPLVSEKIAISEELRRRQRRGLNRVVVITASTIAIVLVVVLATYFGVTKARTYHESVPNSYLAVDPIKDRIDFEDFANRTFRAKLISVQWEKDANAPLYSKQDDDNNIFIVNAADKSNTTLVNAADIKIDGKLISIDGYEISPDKEYVLIQTNNTKLWRHSFYAHYYVFNVKSKEVKPLLQSQDLSAKPEVQYVAWSPSGHSLLYILKNDIYIRKDLGDSVRVTNDGSNLIFNGHSDWVYEEEVLSSQIAVWWSPDSTHIAFLRFNDTNVPDFHYPLYVNDKSYPDDIVIKYPKAGFPNPTVSLNVHALGTEGFKEVPVPNSQPALEDRVITEIEWTTDTHDKLLFRVANRVQDQYKVVLFDVASGNAQVVREASAGDQGWFDPDKSLIYVSPGNSGRQPGYIDLVDINGYNHLAFYSPLDAKEPVWLTQGQWEVVGAPVAVDANSGLVYYISTERDSTERHLYSVTLDGKNKTALTDTSKPGYYSASFSSNSGYYLLTYAGPEIPYQIMRKANSAEEYSVEDNTGLKAALTNIKLPTKRFTTIQSEGATLNAMEILPVGFDESRKYPVLFRVYGGPNSQLVAKTWTASDWHTYLASSPNHQYIIVIVDGRGTGFKGKDFRKVVTKRLGELETIDQVNAGKHWASLPYVDSSKIAIWGWSYGGYMTSKVIEANSRVFKAGIAVAPVTDWRLYDSIYTERYMKTPEANPEGYKKSAVVNTEGFGNSSFLLVHGTADDNVHFQNSALLAHRLTQAKVEFQEHVYTDSDHGINFGKSTQRHLYRSLTDFLTDVFAKQPAAATPSN